MIVRNDDRRPLLVPPGVVLAGVLVDGHGFGDGDHAIAWFRADGTQPVVRVAPVGGHWVALSGPPTSWAQAIGPDGVHGPWVQPGADGRAQLWVPDGTMSVRSGRNNKTEIETTDHSPVVDHLELR